MSKPEPAARMSVSHALAHLQQRRRDHEIVVTNQSSARLWPTLSDHDLDFNYNPSTMSGAVPLGVGLALAKPDCEVIVLSGDGSLLMSLGCLVTTVASGAANLSILLLDNSMYEVTGGQKTAASGNHVDYAGLARAAGFRHVTRFDNLGAWQSGSEAFFASAGPRFAWLEVGPTPREVLQESVSLPPIHDRIADLQTALAVGAK
jgi:sulfopyruvate decarboxylase subunit beta